MSSSDLSAKEFIRRYWRANGLEVSSELVDRQRFLLTFEPGGDVDQDVAAFIAGVGQSQILEPCRQLNLSLSDLGFQILNRHRDELDRIKQGRDPKHDAKYYRRSPDALRLYSQLLELEEQVLSAILGDSDQRRAA